MLRMLAARRSNPVCESRGICLSSLEFPSLGIPPKATSCVESLSSDISCLRHRFARLRRKGPGWLSLAPLVLCVNLLLATAAWMIVALLG
jgi:hypothetical protein